MNDDVPDRDPFAPALFNDFLRALIGRADSLEIIDLEDVITERWPGGEMMETVKIYWRRRQS
jgi:hypothetical protein